MLNQCVRACVRTNDKNARHKLLVLIKRIIILKNMCVLCNLEHKSQPEIENHSTGGAMESMKYKHRKHWN